MRRTDRAEERGIALILVIVVLMALLLIATPFASNMLNHQVATVVHDSADRAQVDEQSLTNHVMAKLRQTHPRYDKTPYVDGIEEIVAAETLDGVGDLDGVANPRGSIWSARVEDEQAKININAASPFALANLFGGRSKLDDNVSDDDTEIALEDVSGFDPNGGYVVVGAELIKYSGISLNALTGCERGINAVDEEPARIGVSESFYFQPGGLIKISDGLRTDYGVVSRVSAGRRTIFSGRGGSVEISSGFTAAAAHRGGEPVIDARVFAINMYRVLREPGKCYRYPTVSAIRRIVDLGIPGFRPEEIERVMPYLTVYSSHDGAARWGNHRTLVDDFVFRGREWFGSKSWIESEVRYPINVNTASEPVLKALLVGLAGESQNEEVDAEVAGKLIKRIVAARKERPLEDEQDVLDRVFEPALEEEEVTRNLRSAIYQCFFDSPMITFLKGGTHRLIFRSLGAYQVETNVSRNNAAGVELARARSKKVVSVASPELLTEFLDTQFDFERNLTPGRYSRFVQTYPVNVEWQRAPQDPPVFDPPNRALKQLQGYVRNQRRERQGRDEKSVWASRKKTGSEGEDEGSVRYRPTRTADDLQAFRGAFNPMRIGVEHFDNNEDIEGRILSDGPMTVGMRSGRFGRRRGGRGGSGMAATSIGLWYQPRWESGQAGRHYIFGIGENSRSDKVELYYDNEKKQLVLEVADAGLNDENTICRAYFPIVMRAYTNYHIACIVAGSRPDQMQIIVDGVPYRGQDQQRHRFLTRLVGGLSENDTTIRVESTKEFPSRGVLLVGEEKIEYSGKTENAFRVVAETNGAVVKRGRGSRNDTDETWTHPDGAAVTLYGYANGLQSDIPQTSGRIAGAPAGWGRWEPGILEGADPSRNIPGAFGLPEDATVIKLRKGTSGGFQETGYALIASPRWEIPVAAQTNPPQPATTRWVGGLELVYYTSLVNDELRGVTRGVETPRMTETMGGDENDWTTPKEFLNPFRVSFPNTQNTLRVIGTYVFPVSLQVSSTNDFLDPGQTNVSERVQIMSGAQGTPEWVRYDEILREGTGGYLARTNWPDLQRLWIASQRAALPEADFTPLAPNIQVTWRPAQGQDPNNPPYNFETLEEFLARVRNQFRFRGCDGTIDNGATNNTEVLQVFRTERPSAGPEDVVTLIDDTGKTKERHTVSHAAPNRNCGIAWGQASRIQSKGHFVGFRKNVGRRWESTLEDLRAGRGGRGRGRSRPGIDRTLSQISFDTRRVTRILKSPSGELPMAEANRVIVGGTFGGESSPCVVDEIETFAFDQSRRGGGGARSTMRRLISTPYTLEYWKQRFDPISPALSQEAYDREEAARKQRLARAKRVIDANTPEIRLLRTDVFYDFDGVTAPRSDRTPIVRRNGGFQTYEQRSRDDRDCGCIRIGEELVIYRGIEDDNTELVLKDCIRGAFGTEPQPHSHGETAFFLSYMEMTFLQGELSAEGSTVTVEETLGFSPQGYFAVFGSAASGEVREVIGYTTHPSRGNRNEFVMPQRVDREHLERMIEEGLEEADRDGGGAGIFRGRFGTVPARHAARAIVLRLPFRYWDRAARNADNPEMGYFQFPIHRHGAFFKSLSWGEKFPHKNLDIRVLARVDRRAPWDSEPNGRTNGLFEFVNPRGQDDPNRIDMQADLLELRVFLEYRSGAFGAYFDADGWKDTPWLTKFRVDYVQPNEVLFREERR